MRRPTTTAPAAPSGRHHRFLEGLPYGARFADVRWNKRYRVHEYTGASPVLPVELAGYATKDFSYTRWIEDDVNGTCAPTWAAPVALTPHPHQVDTAKAINRAYANQWRGFLVASGTGTGKTASTLLGAGAVAHYQGFTPARRARLLIVCPKTVMPQWASTLAMMPGVTSLVRPMVVNYHYKPLAKLITSPQGAGKKTGEAKIRHTIRHGAPAFGFDLIIFDEAHNLKNYPDSLTAVAACTIAELNQPYQPGQRPFVIFATATPGSTPLHLSLMAGLYGRMLDPAGGGTVTPKQWGRFLYDRDFHMSESKSKKGVYRWITASWFGKTATSSDDPVERARYMAETNRVVAAQREDMTRIGQAVTRAIQQQDAPFINHQAKDLAGWPEQQLMPHLIDLNPAQRAAYEQAWSAFRALLRLSPDSRDPTTALAELIRYRQKASLLKVEPMVEAVTGFVDAGNQVVISGEFHDTLTQYQVLLRQGGVGSVIVSGRNPGEREHGRRQFQTGQVPVILTTIAEGISLHAKERFADGGVATANPRVTILHELRLNNITSVQALGRAHRDGQNSVAYIPTFMRTIDEQVVKSFIAKTQNMNAMLGDTDQGLETLFQTAFDAHPQSY